MLLPYPAEAMVAATAVSRPSIAAISSADSSKSNTLMPDSDSS
jgi:hypothetical protein